MANINVSVAYWRIINGVMTINDNMKVISIMNNEIMKINENTAMCAAIIVIYQ